MPCASICSKASGTPVAAIAFPVRSKCPGKIRKYSAAPITVKTAGANQAIRMLLMFFRIFGFQPISLSPAPEIRTPSVGTNIIAAMIICPTCTSPLLQIRAAKNWMRYAAAKVKIRYFITRGLLNSVLCIVFFPPFRRRSPRRNRDGRSAGM